jgi:Tfp pilus assembly protein PilF
MIRRPPTYPLLVLCLVVTGETHIWAQGGKLSGSSTQTGGITPAVDSVTEKNPLSSSLEEIADLFQRAVRSHKEGNLEAAAQDYKRILEKRPEMPEARNNLGMIYQTLGNSDLAKKEYEEALRDEPGYTLALNNLASLLYAEGQYSRACDLWQQATLKNPLDSELRFNLALGYLKTSDSDRAMQSLKKVIALNPRHSLAHYTLGGLLRERGDYEGALKCYLAYLDSKTESSSIAHSEALHQIAELKAYLGLQQD